MEYRKTIKLSADLINTLEDYCTNPPGADADLAKDESVATFATKFSDGWVIHVSVNAPGDLLESPCWTEAVFFRPTEGVLDALIEVASSEPESSILGEWIFKNEFGDTYVVEIVRDNRI